MSVDIVAQWGVNMLVLSTEKLRIPKYHDLKID